MGTLSNGFVYTNSVTGSKSGITSENQFQYKLTWTQYYNINTNKSCLAVKVYLLSGQYGSGPFYPKYAGSYTSGISIDGSNLTAADGSAVADVNGASNRYQFAKNTSTYQELAVQSSGTATPWYSKVISHSSDGSKTVNVQIQYNLYYYNSSSTLVYLAAKADSFSISLQTIPRAGYITVANCKVGESTSIALTRYSSSYTASIVAAYTDGNTQTIATKSSATSFTFTPNATYAYASMGANSASTTVTFTTTTYNGSTTIGTKTTTITVYSAGTAPTLSVSYTIDSTTNSLTNLTNKLIANYSTLKITASATAANGATISSYKIGSGTDMVTGSTRTISNVGTVSSYKITATDSRGVTATRTLNFNIVDYSKPTLTLTQTLPNSSTGSTTGTAKGTWFNDTFGTSGEQNTLALYYRYKVANGSYSSWVTFSNSGSSNTIKGTYTLTVDYTKGYYFQVKAVDKLNTVTSSAVYVCNNPLFYWNKNTFTFNQDVAINGDATMNGNDLVDVKSTQLVTNKKFYNASNDYTGWVLLTNTKSANAYNAGLIWWGSNTSAQSRLGLRQYSPSTSDLTKHSGYYETYYLPYSNTDMSSNASYNILTSKTIKQGSTAPSSVSTTGWSTGTLYIYTP